MQARADARLAEALATAGRADPRDGYRDALRRLRERRPEAFREALRHYEQSLVPAVASGGTEPLAAWIEYGRLIAELSGSGRWVCVDPTGRARDGADPAAGDLLLYLLDGATPAALNVTAPAEPSEAQRATVELLVLGSVGR